MECEPASAKRKLERSPSPPEHDARLEGKKKREEAKDEHAKENPAAKAPTKEPVAAGELVKGKKKKKKKQRDAGEKKKEGGDTTSAPKVSPTISVERIRKEAKAAEEKILNCCLDAAKKVSKEATSVVMTGVSDLMGLISELVQLNSFLEGRLSAVGGEMKRAQAATATAVTESLKVARRIEASAKTAMKPATASYADAVKFSTKSVASSAVKPPQNVVKIFPAEKDRYKDSEATKQAVLSLVNPAKSQIRVKAVKRIHSGGIAIETATKEDLAAFTESKRLRKAGLAATVPARKNPLVIVYDVPSEVAADSVVPHIGKQNMPGVSAEELMASLKVRFRTGRRDAERSSYVLEASPEMRKRLISSGRVYIGWSSCRVQDYLTATRCFKCQAYGHTTKHCRSKEEVCGHCAERGHDFKSCKSRNKNAVCANCKSGGKAHSHSVKDKKCPSYKAALELVVAKTNYG